MPYESLFWSLLVGVTATIAAVLLMNKGRPGFVNLWAQDEPVLEGIGAFIAVFGFTGYLDPQLSVIVTGIGVALMVIGIVSRYWSGLDVELFDKPDFLKRDD